MEGLPANSPALLARQPHENENRPLRSRVTSASFVHIPEGLDSEVELHPVRFWDFKMIPGPLPHMFDIPLGNR